MPEKTTYPEGAPCWAELTSPDVETSKQFYSWLLGWTYQDTPMPTEKPGQEMIYTVCLSNGKQVAGLMAPMPGGEGPLSWNVYLASHSVDEIAQRVEQNDGKIIVAPADVPEQGRMLIALDPDGASFGVWQGAQLGGAEVFGEPGALSWADVKVHDGDRIDAFYRALFEYSSQELLSPDDKYAYTSWKVGDEAVAGRWQFAEGTGDTQPRWNPYFAVEDLDEKVAQLDQWGAVIVEEPMDTPYGRIAVIRDPQGATLSLTQLPEEVA